MEPHVTVTKIMLHLAINGYVALIAEVENMVKDTGIFVCTVELMYVL
jgi:hypothetical protein